MCAENISCTGVLSEAQPSPFNRVGYMLIDSPSFRGLSYIPTRLMNKYAVGSNEAEVRGCGLA